jgi:hypothetical protein
LGYTAAYKNKTLTIKVQHPPTSFSISNMVIAIDASMVVQILVQVVLQQKLEKKSTRYFLQRH